jgi:hypothetical protein
MRDTVSNVWRDTQHHAAVLRTAARMAVLVQEVDGCRQPCGSHRGGGDA